jgi:hypothetical protein
MCWTSARNRYSRHARCRCARSAKGPAIDIHLLTASLSRKGIPNFKGDPAGAAEIIGRMCVPKRSDRYATLAEALDDSAICES